MRRIAALLLFAASPAFAETPEIDAFARKFFGRPLGAQMNYACFSRVYDAAHLVKHPRQNVTDMALLARLDPKEPSYYSLKMQLHLRKNHEMHEAFADCSAKGAGAQSSITCSGACDGGRVEIELKATGSVYLRFPGNATVWNPGPESLGEKPNPKFGADDLLFRLDRARTAVCVPLASDKQEAAALRKAP